MVIAPITDYGAAAMLANELGVNASELRRQAVMKQIAEGRHTSQRPESIAKQKETKRKRFESGDGVPNGHLRNFETIKGVLEKAGIEFLGSPQESAGVRWKIK